MMPMKPINPQAARDLIKKVAERQRSSRMDPVTDQQIDDAAGLLVAMLHGAEKFGVTIDDFDWVTSLPGACFDVIRHKRTR
jgi:hypothetical protein